MFADFNFFNRGRDLATVAWSKIKSLHLFEEPLVLDRVNISRSWNQHLHGDFYKVGRNEFLPHLLNQGGKHVGSGEVKTIRQFLDELQFSGVRTGVGTLRNKSGFDDGNGELLVAQFPPDVLHLMLKGIVPEFGLAVSKKRKFQHINLFLGLPKTLPDIQLDPLKHGPHNAMQHQFDPRCFKAAADIIRGQHHNFYPTDLGALSTDDVLQWLDWMQVHCSKGTDHMVKMNKAGRVQAGYKLESLILQVRGAGLLRQDKKLREMLSIAAQLCGFQRKLD